MKAECWLVPSSVTWGRPRAQWVINEPNKGFLFKAASMARVRAVVGIGTMLNARKILIVDDDSVML